MGQVCGCQEHHVVAVAGLLQILCENDGRLGGLVAHHDRDYPRIGIDVLQERDLHLDGMLVSVGLRYVRDRARQLRAYLLMDRARAERREERFRAERVHRAHAVMVRTYHDVGIRVAVLREETECIGRVGPRCHVSRMGGDGSADRSPIGGWARTPGCQGAVEARVDGCSERIRIGWIEPAGHGGKSHGRRKGLVEKVCFGSPGGGPFT